MYCVHTDVKTALPILCVCRGDASCVYAAVVTKPLSTVGTNKPVDIQMQSGSSRRHAGVVMRVLDCGGRDSFREAWASLYHQVCITAGHRVAADLMVCPYDRRSSRSPCCSVCLAPCAHCVVLLMFHVGRPTINPWGWLEAVWCPVHG